MRARFLSISRLAAGTILKVAAFGVMAHSAHAEEVNSGREMPKARARVYSLQDLLGLAERNYPKVKEAQAKLTYKRAQKLEAYTAPFSEFKSQGGVAIAPNFYGTAVYSPSSDIALTNDMALAWQVGFEGVIPLWTFGKITNTWDLAEANVEMGRYEVRQEKNKIRLEVREAYYGLLATRDAIILTKKAMKSLDEFVANLERDVEEGDADEEDLLKLKMQRAELVAKAATAYKRERHALAGLRFYAGVRGRVDVPDEPLQEIPHTLGDLTKYLEAARLHRPEINLAAAGLKARRAQVEIAKAKFFPDVGLGLSGRLVRSTEITDQRNPFVRDPGNRAFVGAGVVFRWKLDFLPKAAQLAQARAQLEETRALHRFALGGVATKVELAYFTAVEQKTKLDAMREATGYAKRWMIVVQQGIDVGLSEEKDLVEPSKAYALKKIDEIQALYDYNLALAKLSQETGWDGMLKGY